MRRSGLDLSLTGEVLAEWLAERTQLDVAALVNKTGKPLDVKLLTSVESLRAALNRVAPELMHQ
jgi:hypothetical protein